MISVFIMMLLAAAAGEKTWTFEEDEVGKPPAGFYFDTTNDRPDGKWEVVQDGERRVLAQVDKNQDDKRQALAVVEKSSFKNVRLAAKIKVVAGDEDRTAGIIWRYKNSENYLVARIDIKHKNVRLFRVVDGNRVKFGGADKLKVEYNRWYTLRIEHRGSKIKVYLDDEMLFDEHDRHFTKAGRVGLWSKADSISYFDELKAEELDDD